MIALLRPIVAAAVIALAGCSQIPGNAIVLVADDQGAVGRADVSTDAGSVALAAANTVVGVDDRRRPPAQPLAVADADIRSVFGGALAAQPTRPRVFIIRFMAGQAEPLPESEPEIAAAVRYARGIEAPDLSVVGHADATGSAATNRELSLQRATRIRDALVAGGIEPARMRIESHGSGNPLVPSPAGTPEPRNRRVEITIR